MSDTNPLLREWATPPFSSITIDHFREAIDTTLAEARAEIDAIADCADEPTFENTVEALERSGHALDRVLGVFYPLLSADATEAMMDLAEEISPKLSKHSADTTLNSRLFDRIRTVYDHRADRPDLTPEQITLLTDTYKSFTRSGALLTGTDRERYRAITSRMSELTTRFGRNVKKELATYRTDITDPARMEGLPDHIVADAAALAREEGRDARWTLTLDQPVYMAVMKHAADRSLREELYRLYTARNTAGEYSNMEIITELTALRLELARLLGYDDYASYKLEMTMARTPQAVYSLLDRLREAYAPALDCELAELREFAGTGELMPWDYAYQANRLRKLRHDFDPEAMRPYFELGAVTDGVFGLASRLYGISFSPAGNDVEVYHPDVKAYCVTDADGTRLGLLYCDFFPRPGRKGPGAWMTEFREADATTRPLVNIVMNFTKPAADRPSLLTPDEVGTFLHEFGHSLHALLTRARYRSQAGTNVRRDFVELPSQFMENFLTAPEFLNSFARHYQTGEPLPQAMLDRMIESRRFGAAWACIRQLNFGYLDMAWHTITAPVTDAAAFERRATAATTPLPAPDSSLTSPQFGHIFSGGYASGYYSYKWAE
ncbi:MAG: M3 family metallopeptidase, partial [Muribaculaceae bacterium]|nr:M3 family metallopeptidase [Muribaculaceae bacterium]